MHDVTADSEDWTKKLLLQREFTAGGVLRYSLNSLIRANTYTAETGITSNCKQTTTNAFGNARQPRRMKRSRVPVSMTIPDKTSRILSTNPKNVTATLAAATAI